MTTIVKKKVKKFEYVGFVSMDCRKLNAKSFSSLVLKYHHFILSQAPSLSIYSHLLYAFLRTKVDCIAIRLQDLISFIAATEFSHSFRYTLPQ